MAARTSILWAAMLLASGFAAAASTASTTDPVTNSGFEHPPARDTLADATADTPADACYGVGHQVLYGPDSPQGRATGGEAGDPDPEQADPVGAAAGAADDPNGTLEAQLACDFAREHGDDVAFVQPREWTTRPSGWITDPEQPSTLFPTDADDDPADREAVIVPDASASNHNLWQAFPSKHQAFTPNADALSFRIEAGDIPDHAEVRLTLTTTLPDDPSFTAYNDCHLVFGAQQLQAALAATSDGSVHADPTGAAFDDRTPVCDDLDQAWDQADDEADKRAVLAQTRITMLSFWSWNLETTERTVIDDVRLPGASLAAEEAGHWAPG